METKDRKFFVIVTGSLERWYTAEHTHTHRDEGKRDYQCVRWGLSLIYEIRKEYLRTKRREWGFG